MIVPVVAVVVMAVTEKVITKKIWWTAFPDEMVPETERVDYKQIDGDRDERARL